MEKKKVLFINGHLNAGGVERSLVDVLRHFDYAKNEVDLLLLEGTGDYLSEIPSNVHVIMYPLNEASGPLLRTLFGTFVHGDFILFFYRLFMLFRKILGDKIMKYAFILFRNGKEVYDVVIAYRPEAAALLAAFTFRTKKRFLWWHHGERNIYGKKQKEYLNVCSKFDSIIAVSESSASIVKETFPLLVNRVLVIPNMLCVDDIRKKGKETPLMMDISVWNVVSVARMSPEKNMSLCINVANCLREHDFMFHWYMIGDGVEAMKLQSMVKLYKLDNYFTFTGKLVNPYPYIQHADVLFHPSLVESQGLTVLEAMSLYTPVIVVESAGTKEYVVNKTNGILIRSDVKEAADAILQLYFDKQMAAKMVNNAIQTISVFSPQVVMRKIEQIITAK